MPVPFEDLINHENTKNSFNVQCTGTVGIILHVD